jgi:hypothetical protein
MMESRSGLRVTAPTGTRNCVIVAGVALSRTDVTNAAVTVIEAVLAHEAGCPCAYLIKVGKALSGEFGLALGGTKQRLGVVVAHARPGVHKLISLHITHIA